MFTWTGSWTEAAGCHAAALPAVILIFSDSTAQGAVVYVSGSAEKMPQDVAKTLEGIAADHGSLNATDAQAYVRQLELSRRYIVEAWS